MTNVDDSRLIKRGLTANLFYGDASGGVSALRATPLSVKEITRFFCHALKTLEEDARHAHGCFQKP